MDMSRGTNLCAFAHRPAMIGQPQPATEQAKTRDTASEQEKPVSREVPREIGGRGGLEPTRYGDWEKNGRCIDF